MLGLVGALSRSPHTEEREQLSTVCFSDRAFDRSEQPAGVFCQAGSFRGDSRDDGGSGLSCEFWDGSNRDRFLRCSAHAACALGEHGLGGIEIAVSGALLPRI